MPKVPEKKYWVVRGSAIHNRGIFARVDVPNDVPIIQYIGEKITKAESTRRGLALEEKARKTGGAAVYIFTLNSRHDIDGGFPGNPARLINHSCNANCEAYIIKGEIWIYSLREIKKGEELTYNYGFELETWEDHPCRCGNSNCVGYIVDRKYWKKLGRILEKRKEKVKKIAELEARAKVLQKELKELDKPVKAKKPAKKAKKAA
ncbi:MAG: SET domain-containing protein-lysine N-methyltransferase [Verrucomicrobiota bacterium]